MKLLKSEVWYCNPFPNARRRIKVNRPISPILTLKLVAMATSLEWSKKDRSVIYDQIPTIRWKFGENRSVRSWDNLSQRIYYFKNEGCTPTTLSNSGVTGPKVKSKNPGLIFREIWGLHVDYGPEKSLLNFWRLMLGYPLGLWIVQ